MKRFFQLLLLIFSIFIIEIAPVHAQANLKNMDLSHVNVDSLSNQQIKSLLKQAQARGLSEGELEKLALARGMSPAQIQKLKERIQEIQSGGSSQASIADSLQRLRYKSSYSSILQARQAPFGSYVSADTTDTT
ncbi:MAG TPA: hypothetical protein VKA34_08715, partial [Balneolales bacterium]|nr:hypothetical protein [Balneolales bacterium]